MTLAAQKAEQTAKADASQGESALRLGVQQAPAGGQGGVEIVGVDPNGPAASKGLANGDLIMQVSGKPVTQPGEVKALIASAKQDGMKSSLMLVKSVSVVFRPRP